MKKSLILIIILCIFLVACKSNTTETNVTNENTVSQFTCVNKFVDCYIGINKCKELCNIEYEKTEKESSDKQVLIDCKIKCSDETCDKLEKECIRDLS